MARSSAYGNILGQVPGWVFGGDFGDIASLLNKRDQGYEQLQRQEIQNDLDQITLEKKKQQADFDEELKRANIFGDAQDATPTLRDMYGRIRDTAKGLGSVDEYINMQEKIDAIDRQKQQDDIAKQYKEALISAKNRSGTKSSSSGSGSKRLFQLENPDTGEKGVFLADEANQKLRQGWDFYKKDDLADMLGGNKKSQPTALSGPSSIGQFINGFLGSDSKPGEAATKEQQKLVDGIKGDVAASNVPPRPPKPGMKWQRNKKTGELREVPA